MGTPDEASIRPLAGATWLAQARPMCLLVVRSRVYGTHATCGWRTRVCWNPRALAEPEVTDSLLLGRTRGGAAKPRGVEGVETRRLWYVCAYVCLCVCGLVCVCVCGDWCVPLGASVEGQVDERRERA